MGTWCTLGVERSRRDRERVETINSQSSSINRMYSGIERLKSRFRNHTCERCGKKVGRIAGLKQ